MKKPSDSLATLSPEELALTKRWVQTWQKAGPELDRMRREQLRQTDTVEAMQKLAGAFESASFLHQSRATSGLVEQQAWFKKLRPCSNG